MINDTFNRMGKINGIVIFSYFIINIIITVKYIEIYDNLRNAGITDQSIILIPMFNIILIYLLYTFHECTLNLTPHNISKISMCMACICIMLGIIPFVGDTFDITSIAVEYWKIADIIAYILIVYLTAYGVLNYSVNIKQKYDNK